MSRTRAALVVLSCLSLLAAVSAGQPSTAPAGFEELQRVQLADSANLELVMGLVERKAKSTSGKHHHPRGELGLVLGGAVVVTTEDGAVEKLEAGDSFYQPPMKWHVISTGANGAKAVVFRVVERGQPMVVPVE